MVLAPIPMALPLVPRALAVLLAEAELVVRARPLATWVGLLVVLLLHLSLLMGLPHRQLSLPAPVKIMHSEISLDLPGANNNAQ